MSAPMHPRLRELLDAGILGALEVHFAEAVCRLASCGEGPAALGAAMASRSVLHGHVCVELGRLAGNPIVDSEGQPIPGRRWPDLTAWLVSLRASGLVGAESDFTPLVLDDDGRLYLRRYYAYEAALARAIRRRAADATAAVDRELLRGGLDRLFPRAESEPGSAPDLQRLAAFAAVDRQFCVISGGPGTGKTTTVVKILALLQEQARARGRFPLRVVLLAPTGKAAARLAQAVSRGKAVLPVDESIRAAIPEEASTIHRRLGFRPDRPTRFRHDADNPLPADVVVVDEASMVDLALMTKLVEATPQRARLILLGDQDQLSSVEAGAILGDICHAGSPRPAPSSEFARRAREMGCALPDVERAGPDIAIRDCIIQLERSWRFGEQSGIGRLARAINAGDGEAAAALLVDASAASTVAGRGLALVEPDEDRTRTAALISRLAVEGYGSYLAAETPTQALQRLDAFRLLCAHRTGSFGSERVNALVEQALARAGRIRIDRPWFSHRPVIVTQNDYALGLFNGDVGVVLPAAEADDKSQLFAHFAGPGGTTRHLLPARLPAHESVFAMTVHKSQGSEFDDVAVLLPPQVSRVLTRELLYTAVTRARVRVTLIGTVDVVRSAIGRRIQRASGLVDALWTP